MLIGPAFINKSSHIKTIVDFGIPTLEIFLNKNKFGAQLALYKFSEISTSTSSYFRYSNQVLGRINKCSVSKKPHLICNCLILSKVYCFGVKVPWWVFFKYVSSLSDLCSSRTVDALLNDVTVLDVISLLPESDSSSDKITIAFCAIHTRYSSLTASIRTRYSSLISSLWRNVLSKFSLALNIMRITSVTCEFLFLSEWNWRTR